MLNYYPMALNVPHMGWFTLQSSRFSPGSILELPGRGLLNHTDDWAPLLRFKFNWSDGGEEAALVSLKHSPCNCNGKVELRTPANEEGQGEGQQTQGKTFSKDWVIAMTVLT